MASSTSAEVLTARPQDITELNDSVWELQKPKGPPEVDLIFFHGLQKSREDLNEADWKTWVSRNGKVVWPKDWLGAQFPNARIWSISYNALAVRENNSSQMRLKQITENLLHDLIMDRRHGAGRNCPVIFIGHSLGGIIIKRLLIECVRQNALRGNLDTRITEFLGNCKGVFYYSTPFGGSRLGDWLNLLPFNNEPVVKLLTVLNAETAEINEEFRQYWGRDGGQALKSSFILEGMKTTYMGISRQVVEEGSARSNVDAFYTATKADHIDVCKPLNPETDNTYKILEEFIRGAVMEDKLTEKQADELT